MDFEDTGLSGQAREDIETLWNFHVVDSGSVKGDFLLVLGSHDKRVADRAAELYLSEHAAALVVVTGGAGKVTHAEWVRPEAEIYAERLAAAGVPAEAIIVEVGATNTGDNFEFSKALLHERNISVDTGIAVCKPYMARRALSVAHKRWPEVSWHTRPPRIGLWDYPTEEVPFGRMVNLMVGDLQRLKLYADRGFQAPVDVPADIWAAYDRLVGLGYDDFVLT